jgi:two-component system, chemotaxis family, protein-glutamate methylesterase/glutaminase
MDRPLPASPVRVLIVDDSALFRQMLAALLSADPAIQVVGTAPDPLIAREKIKALHPDVLTLDVEMPRMGGLEFLEKLMRLHPMPVIMVSSQTGAGTAAALRALELGAVDVFCKPERAADLESRGRELADLVKAAAEAHPMCATPAARLSRLRPPSAAATLAPAGWKLVAIGASTGGVEALRDIVTVLPPQSPPLLITQHIPPRFSTSFASRLDGLSAIAVTEAEDGVPIRPGHAYIAPGQRQLAVRRAGGALVTHVFDGPPVSGHRPSVDVLFHSVAATCGSGAVGVILTGMGRDGADGLLAMRRSGATTLGQDRDSCVVHGMPKAARDLGAVERELPLSRIAEEILRVSWYALAKS